MGGNGGGASGSIADAFVALLTDLVHILRDSMPRRYRLSLESGDPAPLFTGDLSSARGRQERMMALGFFYGKIDGVDGPVTQRCWQYMREELAPGATDAAYESTIRTRLKAIIQKEDGSHAHEADPAQNARIVYPGAFCFTADSQLGDPLSAHRRNAENTAWKENVGLGKIPLLAKVVDRDTGKPAPNVRVSFEFVAPYAPIDGQKAYLNSISSATESAQSPRAYIDGKLVSAGSPFGYNCPTAKGGRTPSDVFGVLIAKGSVRGFPYKTTTSGRPNKQSAIAITDANGMTGVVLRLSRTAGDSYKIRVRVIKKGGVPLDPEEGKTTGVLTIWRNIRVSKIIVKPQAGAFVGSPPADPGMVGALGAISTVDMQTEFAKAFLDLSVDREAAAPLQLTADNYRTAIETARAATRNPKNYDLETLIRSDFNSPYLFWLEDDTNYNANRKAGSRELKLALQATWEKDIQGILDGLAEEFMKYFTTNGVPGVMVVRSEIGDSYSYWNNPNRPTYADGTRWIGTTSGVAVKKRGCFLWYPDSVYVNSMSYPLTINTLHEMGHVLYLRHHYTEENPPGTPAGGFPANHDSTDFCIMGYLKLTTNDYCGKCLLKLRGWDETKI